MTRLDIMLLVGKVYQFRQDYSVKKLEQRIYHLIMCPMLELKHIEVDYHFVWERILRREWLRLILFLQRIRWLTNLLKIYMYVCVYIHIYTHKPSRGVISHRTYQHAMHTYPSLVYQWFFQARVYFYRNKVSFAVATLSSFLLLFLLNLSLVQITTTFLSFLSLNP